MKNKVEMVVLVFIGCGSSSIVQEESFDSGISDYRIDAGIESGVDTFKNISDARLPNPPDVFEKPQDAASLALDVMPATKLDSNKPPGCLFTGTNIATAMRETLIVANGEQCNTRVEDQGLLSGYCRDGDCCNQGCWDSNFKRCVPRSEQTRDKCGGAGELCYAKGTCP